MKKKKEQNININSDEILASVNKEPKGAKKKSNKKKEKKKGVAKKTTPIKQEKSNKKKKSKKPKKKVSKITKIKTEAQLKKEKRRKKLALFLLIVILWEVLSRYNIINPFLFIISSNIAIITAWPRSTAPAGAASFFLTGGNGMCRYRAFFAIR